MLRILLASLLTLAAFAALAPAASATCIDANPDDDGVGTNGCNVPVGGDCKVLVYGSLPGVSSGCSPIVCVRECVPYDCVQDCDGPADSLASADASMMAGPCTNDLNPTDDNGIGGRCTVGTVTCSWRALSSLDVPQFPRCDPGFIYCVTEPCYYYPLQ